MSVFYEIPLKSFEIIFYWCERGMSSITGIDYNKIGRRSSTFDRKNKFFRYKFYGELKPVKNSFFPKAIDLKMTWNFKKIVKILL